MKDQATRLRELMSLNKLKGHSANAQNPTTSPLPTKLDARIIAISSGKGGVGKTNVTVNLGLALAKLGKKVVLLDADLGLSNVDVVMGIVPKYNLFHLIQHQKTIEEIMVEGPLGIKVISGGSGMLDLVNLSDEEIIKLLESFAKLNDYADYLLIDTGAGINKSVFSFIHAANEVIMVISPDPTSITDAYAVIKNIVKGDKQIKVIINKAESHKEGYDVFHKINSATRRFLGIELESMGILLDDPNVKRAVKLQKPFLLNSPNAIASKGIELIAYNLLNNSSYVKEMSQFNVFMQKLFSTIQ